MKTMKGMFVLAMLLVTLLGSACEKERFSSKGGFAVAMTDAPADYSRLDVEIVSVSAYSAASGWVQLSSGARTVNVLSLTNGKQVQLAMNSDVEAGAYTRLKIVFGDNHKLTVTGHSAVLLGGITGTIDLNLSYAGPREIIIETEHQVIADASTELLIDFHAAESVVDSAGEHYLRPVITQIKDRFTGIRGHLEASVSALVTASSDGGGASFTTYVDAEGNFLIRDMREGVYDIVIQPVSEMGSNPPDPITIENVTVVQGEIRSIGTIQV